jgi:hypothetical protein
LGKWDTTAGGALPGQDGPVAVEVTEASFNYDAQYQNGEVLVFILEGECDHEFWNGYQLYSIGTGWETEDNQIVEHPTRDGFVNSTNYARFFTAALEIEEIRDVLMERDSEGSGEGPADASIWEGLTLLLEAVEIPGFNKGDKPRNVLLPVGLVTDDDGGKKKKKKKKSKSGKAEAGDGLSKSTLKTLAGEAESYDEFVETVLTQYPEIEDNDSLYDLLLDEQAWDI